MDCQSPYDEITTPEIKITSPNFPNGYGNNKDCQLKIRFFANQTVSVTLDTFDVQFHPSCQYDFLAIYDGETTDSPMLATKLCGPNAAGIPIQSTGNTMTLHFHSDSSMTKSGFKLHVSAGKKKEVFFMNLFVDGNFMIMNLVITTATFTNLQCQSEQRPFQQQHIIQF